ncbi:MAG: PAS domain S-box protein [Promethearchaeota archaeon]
MDDKAFIKEKALTEIALDVQIDTFFVFDPLTGKTIRWNKAFRDISGYTDEEISQLKAPESYYDKKELQELANSVDIIMQGGRTLNEVHLITKSGNKIPFEYTGSGIFDDKNHLKYIVAIGRNLTERKKNAEKIEETTALFKTIAEQSLMGICIVQDNNVQYVNQKVADEIGYPHEDIKNWSLEDLLALVHPEDKAFVREQAYKKQRGDPNVINIYEHRLINKKGQVIWIKNLSKTIIYNGKPADFIIQDYITERKMMENELKSTEERLRSLIQETTDAVFCYEFKTPISIDLPLEEQVKRMYDCVLIECNKACAASYGSDDAGKVIGRNLTDLFGTVPNSLDGLFRELIDNNYHIIDGLGVEVLPDGAERYFLNNGHCVIENGHIIRVWGTYRDITPQKLAEIKLKESEEKYRNLFETAPFGIALFNLSGEIIDINKSLLNMIGYSKEDLIGKNYSNLNIYTNFNGLNFESREETMLKGSLPSSREIPIITRDGNEIWISSQLFFVHIGEEKFIQAIINDVTKRKEAEKEINNIAKFPSENPNPVLRASIDKILYINPSGIKILKIKEGEMLPDFLMEVVSTSLSDFKIKEFELKICDKTYLFTITPVEDTDYVNIYGNDITERKQNEEMVKKSEEKYRKAYDQADFYKDLFVHDMSNIIHGILAATDLYSKYLNYSEKIEKGEEMFEMVHKIAERGADLISNIRKLSTIENSKMTFKRIDVCDSLKEALKYVQNKEKQKKIKITVQSFSNNILVQANELLLDVFENVLSNAIIYNVNDIVLIDVVITKISEKNKKFIVLEFSDNGVGIEDSRKNKIFSVGNKKDKDGKGMGIGLSLVKKTIENYGGKIEVKDKIKGDYSKGSTFVLTIPSID